MTGKQWLTIEDWLECKLSLCPMEIKHDLRIECSPDSVAQVIFSQPNIGSTVLLNGCNQESTQLITHPELLIILLFVERLEDNEILMIENVMQISRIIDPKSKAIVEKHEIPKIKSTLICMDAENYIDYSPNQFEEDNCLRELNKCLLAFRQNTCTPMSSKMLKIMSNHSLTSRDHCNRGRLSPIGENQYASERSSLDCATKIIIEPISPTTSTPTFNSQMDENAIDKRRNWLNLSENKVKNSTDNDNLTSEDKRRGRFIVLGSSGEFLPVNRGVPSPATTDNRASIFFNDDQSDEEDVFYSARNSLNEDDVASENSNDEVFDHQRYSIELETPENRLRFAQKLKDALKLENGYTESTDDCSIGESEFDDSYAVDIFIESGSKLQDQEIKIRRGTSTGFILEENNSFDDFQMLNESKNRESKLKRNKTGDSSSYSFETEESDLEEMYNKIQCWMNDPLENCNRKLDSRDKTIFHYANSLLKRALSEGYLSENIENATSSNLNDYSVLTSQQRRKMIRNFKSLSLEVAKYKNQMNSQTVSVFHF
jgi:poly(ADP-ribose) glycohydrolase